jgi:hypothetical protein
MRWFLELSQQGTHNTRDHHDLSAGLRQFHRNRSDKSLGIANFRFTEVQIRLFVCDIIGAGASSPKL